jgi:hypothetical protein
MALKQSVGSGSGPTNFTYMSAVVQSVDLDQQLAVVKTSLKNQQVVSMTRLPGRVEPPKVGETWIITRQYGSWVFVILINPPRTTGTTAQRPPLPSTGQQFYDTTLDQPVWYGNAGWVDAMGSAV